MKKITLIAFVFLMSLVKLQAQVTVSPGIRGGLNISNLTNFDSDPKSDFYAGGFVAIKFNKYFTLQPELTYTRQGAEVREFEIGGPGSRTVNYDLNYISIGAVAKFHFGGGGFHILGGPSLDIKTDDNFPAYDYNPIGTDFSIVGGIGYTLPNGLGFEARFKQGLIDIYGYDGIDSNYYYDDLILNTVFQFGISYTFKVK
ncbi:porin family protein [Flavobacterium agrisoli]|uniref:PorT family protein n=1 Tax=Flavobacterium agrisoli TaxID=2793066 RepID=A0A934PN92_9FLAO|nr:porin family protein [Flavobacterium agrisoli]MBK0369538.1 PorT family protein [Flavobacterium agrisoli]